MCSPEACFINPSAGKGSPIVHLSSLAVPDLSDFDLTGMQLGRKGTLTPKQIHSPFRLDVRNEPQVQSE